MPAHCGVDVVVCIPTLERGNEGNLSAKNVNLSLRESYALFPFFWIPGCMKDAVNEHLTTYVLVKNGIWESPYQCPTILIMNFRIEFRSTTDLLNSGIHTA